MKKLFVYPSFLAFVLLIAFSCKKDDDAVPDYALNISGGWKYFKGADKEKYIQVNKDRTYSILSSDAQGIRDRNDGILLVTANQIMIDKGVAGDYSDVNVYNYGVKGDTLTLTKPSQTLVLVRDKTAPDTSTWIKSVSAVVKIKAPISDATDITYDGSLLWYGNGYASSYIYKYNPLNSAKDSLKVVQYAWSVEADGTNLWVSSDGSNTITKINKTTGATITTSIAMGAWIYGIAKDNNFLWCYSHNENKLYKYNTTDNTLPSITDIYSDWEGLAMVGSNLYVAANGKLHKCTMSPLTGTSSYELPGYHIFGVAYDGTSFWVSAYKLPNEWAEIIKLSGVD